MLDKMGAKSPEAAPLVRAHSIIVSAGGDTAHDLASELYSLAQRIERGELTKGCSGGSSCGSIYSYVKDPTMTHDRYFEEIEKRIKADAALSPDKPSSDDGGEGG